DHVVQHGAPGRAIVVEAGNASVDLERWGVEETSTEQRVEDRPVNGLAGLGVHSSHRGVLLLRWNSSEGSGGGGKVPSGVFYCWRKTAGKQAKEGHLSHPPRDPHAG